MKRHFIILIVVLNCSECWSQAAQVPIFSSKADSAEYNRVTNMIMTIYRSPRPNDSVDKVRKQLDSLSKIVTKLREKIVGFKYVYTADKKFTQYEDLRSGSVKPEAVTQLSISGRQLKSLPPEVYRCTNLQELELVNTSVSSLPSRLNKLPKLTSVYVYNNIIKGSLKLGRNNHVKEMSIRGVKAESLPRTFRRFKMLDTLDLSRNIGLSAFPNIYKNRRLSKVNLMENIITLEDLKPVKNQTLTELNLIRNQIKVVPGAIGGFIGLRKLDLNYNQVASVSPDISKLRNLEALTFYGNKLESIPPAIYDLPNLREIDLYFNQIKTIDPGIAKLQGLRTLFLSNNKLISLPDDIGRLTNLRALYLHNNRISELPESMSQMKSLRILRINHNQFTLFPEPVLALTELENLDVSHNLLHEFPPELSGFKKLQILVVGDNPWENKGEILRVAEALEPGGTIVHGK